MKKYISEDSISDYEREESEEGVLYTSAIA